MTHAMPIDYECVFIFCIEIDTVYIWLQPACKTRLENMSMHHRKINGALVLRKTRASFTDESHAAVSKRIFREPRRHPRAEVGRRLNSAEIKLDYLNRPTRATHALDQPPAFAFCFASCFRSLESRTFFRKVMRFGVSSTCSSSSMYERTSSRFILAGGLKFSAVW